MLEKFCRTELGQNITENLEPLLIFTTVLDSDYQDRLFSIAKIDPIDILLRFRYHIRRRSIFEDQKCVLYIGGYFYSSIKIA